MREVFMAFGIPSTRTSVSRSLSLSLSLGDKVEIFVSHLCFVAVWVSEDVCSFVCVIGTNDVGDFHFNIVIPEAGCDIDVHQFDREGGRGVTATFV